MKRILVIFTVVVLATISQSCFANDTIGAQAEGGIEFKKTNDISMEKEVLTISRRKVRVEYEFINITDHPITEQIYFPMPLDDLDPCYGHDGELENFALWVDGVPVKLSRTVRAVLHSGRDVTQFMRQYGLTDDEIYSPNQNSVCSEGEDKGESSETGGISHIDTELQRKWKRVREALGTNTVWEASSIYYWTQVFPPGKTLKVVHEYVPFFGTDSADITFRSDGGIKTAQQLDERLGIGGQLSVCMDNGTLKFAQKIERKDGWGFMHSLVKYVLTTGANWSGPIKDFTLNLKKDSPDDVISLCFEGQFRKTSPLVLSSHVKNFVPNKDLVIAFLFQGP